jgi:hypothetical protein
MRTRFLIACVPWLLCVPGLLFSLGMSAGAGIESYSRIADPANARPDHTPLPALILISVTVPCAWLALLVLTVAWIRQQRLTRRWPLAGTGTALLCLLAFGFALGPPGFMMAAMYASPGIVFALYLCRFHLVNPAARTPTPV